MKRNFLDGGNKIACKQNIPLLEISTYCTNEKPNCTKDTTKRVDITNGTTWVVNDNGQAFPLERPSAAIFLGWTHLLMPTRFDLPTGAQKK